MATPITTTTGRVVWGNPFERQAVIDDKTKQQAIDPKTGQPVWEYAFGLAIPKADFPPIWGAMTAEAAKVMNGVVPPYDPNARDSFAYKFVDGDAMAPAVPARGIPSKPYSEREGYGGCYVLAIKSRLPNPPPLFVWTGQAWGQADPANLQGGNKFKTGDYVQVGLNIDGHAGQSPGLYLNPNGIQFVGFGELIMRGPDANAMFGAGPAALPPGASAAPVAPAGAPMMPGQPAAPNGAPGAVPMPGNPVQAPIAGPSPAPAPVSTASPTSPGMPGMPGAPAAPAVAPVPGFAAGTPGMPGQPPATPPAPPAPPAAPQRQQAGVDANGVAYYYKADGSGTTEY